MEEAIAIIMILIMVLGISIRIKENIEFVIGKTKVLRIPLIAAIFYPISSMIYLFITSLSIDKYYDLIYNDITKPIHIIIFIVAPIIVIITAIIAIVKARKNNIKLITNGSYLIGTLFFITIGIMPIIDIILFLKKCYSEYQ